MLELGANILSSAPASMVPDLEEVNRILPGYRVLSVIGRGGMGLVYKAIQRSLDRHVALKLLPRSIGEVSESHWHERFQIEARAMAKLSHPGIVTVHDFGIASNGMLYIAMEYVAGESLASLLSREGKLQPERSVEMALQLCNALHYAHEHGIVHRDIKPSNILVGGESGYKVADFGLAKMDCDTDTAVLTLSKMALGTIHYMAPEVLICGDPADPRADIYAVGVLLYQVLTGEIPYGLAENASSRVPNIDGGLDAIIAKAMHRNPEARYQTVHELRTALERFNSRYRDGGGAIQQSRLAITKMVILCLSLLALVPVVPFLRKSDNQSSGHARLANPNPSPVVVNSLGMKFVAVDGIKGLVCIHETRRRDWAAYVSENPAADSGWRGRPNGVALMDEENHPVIFVNYPDVDAFCKWLGKKEGRIYRLPDDREWSVAAGLGDREVASEAPGSLNQKVPNEYPWGSAWPPPSEAVNLAGSRPEETIPGLTPIPAFWDGFPTTAPVMSFEPNPVGLYDLGGNVWEMCRDWLDSSHSWRVIRGGSWADQGIGTLLSSSRGRAMPEARQSGVGFRLILEAHSGSAFLSP